MSLLRDFIRSRLYAPSGYFQAHNTVVRLPEPQPVPFRSLGGQPEYLHRLSVQYAASDGWLTPSEIFRPYYSQGIASYVSRALSHPNTLAVVEIGAGTGSFAQSFCTSWSISAAQPLLSSYSIVEVSKPLFEQQKRLVQQLRSVVDVHHFNEDGASWAPPREIFQAADACCVILCEVLDNVQHDCIRLVPGVSSSLLRRAELDVEECRVLPNGALDWQPLSDPLVAAVAELGQEHISRHTTSLASLISRSLLFDHAETRAYLPTGAYELFRNLRSVFCEVGKPVLLVVADFHAFPNALPGFLGPVIQSKQAGVTRELTSLEDFVAQPSSNWDIMFPTRFELTKTLVESAFGRQLTGAVCHPQGSFFKNVVADPELAKATTTKSGYNPLFEDYRNMSIMSFLLDFSSPLP